MNGYAFIDYSNIAHAIWCTTTNVDLSDCSDDAEVDNRMLEVCTGRMEKKLKAMVRELGHPQPILVLDNFSIHKSDLYIKYKMNRPSLGAKPVGRLVDWAVQNYPKHVCESLEHEADDVIATLCSRNKETESIVVSADKDLWQLINGRVKVYCPLKRKFIETEDIINAFDVAKPEHVVLHKTCWGDYGDNVPNVMPRMHKQILPMIRKSDGTLRDLTLRIEDQWSSLTERCRNLYHSGRQQLAINYQIVKLATDCQITWH